RCSALRVLCLQEDVADRVLEMLRGAMAELQVGRPDRLAVDVGPVIDDEARAGILRHIDALRANYAAAGVEAALTPFIDDTATAFAEADLIVCRAGASTVTEIAAVGAAAVFVPFPHAVDDHQTANARFLADAGGGWLVQQRDLSAGSLAQLLQNTERAALLER
ncbi:aldehyde dehydrogenase family protein, partial [Raoultella sp. 18079]|uniref:aldehyde dehydrogenase family protein n=1 Tax=Raoultella sp. 18079 TaxID=2681458 RepID=UPI001359BD1D